MVHIETIESVASGSFKFVKKLGEGTFGEVWQANVILPNTIPTGNRVAIKVIKVRSSIHISNLKYLMILILFCIFL